MLVGIDMLLKGLRERDFTEQHIDRQKQYTSVRRLQKELTQFDASTIYLGQASAFPQHAVGTPGCLILQPNTMVPIELPACDYILLDRAKSVDALYKDLQDVWDSIENTYIWRFYNTLTTCVSISQALRFLSEAMNCHPILIADKERWLLNYVNCDGVNDPSFSNILKSGRAEPLYIKAAEEEGTRYRTNGTTYPIEIGYGKFRTDKRIFCNLYDHGNYLGFVIALEDGRAFERVDFKLIGSFCNYIAAALQNGSSQNAQTLSEYFYAQEFQTLLAQSSGNQDWIPFWKQRNHLSNTQTFCVYVLENRPAGDLLMTGIADILQGFLWQTMHTADLTVLLTDRAIPLPAKQRFAALLREHRLLAGESEPFGEIQAISYAYQQAKEALCLGSRLRVSEPVCEYEKLKTYSFVSKIPPELLLQFDTAELDVLQAYDEQKGTEYCKTLYTYLHHTCSKSAVAKELYLHRNTVSYQLERIEEILNLDLSDAGVCFRLYLFFMARRLGIGRSCEKSENDAALR